MGKDTNEFVIIALKPIKGCEKKYLKVLKEDEIYYFYKNYSINKETDKIEFTSRIPSNLYSINGININISAIVGKNGSGKSTLVEMLLRIINNLSKRQNSLEHELEFTNGLRADFYFKTDNYYKIRILDKRIFVYKYNNKGERDKKTCRNFNLKQFFYTIAVNYSHYAYNLIDMGDNVDWLTGVFHKNDGYQTPLVINPMRTNGNIDINNENHLAKSRLIANLLLPVSGNKLNFRKLTENGTAVALNLSLLKSKKESVIYNLTTETEISNIKLNDIKIDKEKFKQEISKIFNYKFFRNLEDSYEIVLDYIFYKLVSIATTYIDYVEYFDMEGKCFNQDKLSEFINKLYNDESHITFKLKQALYFLGSKHIKLSSHTIKLEDLEVTIENQLKKFKKRESKFNRIYLIPPPIFDVDILLKSDKISKETYTLTSLSSGEKQLVYSISSILYHLINLDSITNYKERIGYKYVNIILEEIELYSHPEMQRKYIKYILECISRLNLKKIKSLNLCFVTHSPFILSDIPDKNIIFLNENGVKTSETKTFGGNIHDLLRNKFFLDEGFIGEFAKKKIQDTIDNLQEDSSVINDDNNEIIRTIELIGEPFLQMKLLEMYDSKFKCSTGNQYRIKQLEEEIKRLKNG